MVQRRRAITRFSSIFLASHGMVSFRFVSFRFSCKHASTSIDLSNTQWITDPKRPKRCSISRSRGNAATRDFNRDKNSYSVIGSCEYRSLRRQVSSFPFFWEFQWKSRRTWRYGKVRNFETGFENEYWKSYIHDVSARTSNSAFPSWQIVAAACNGGVVASRKNN